MKNEVKVSFYLKKNESKEDVGCPVMARLTVGTTEAVFSAKLTAPADLWAEGRAKGKSRTATEINRRPDELRASALSHHRELSAVRQRVTADEVKTMLLGMASGQETLLAYFRAHNEKFDKRVGVNRAAGSAKVYRNALRHISNFVAEKYNLSDIPFTALDRSFIDKYDLYLRTERKMSQGSIVLLTVRLGSIINHAVADGIITADPFAGYERKYPNPKTDGAAVEFVARLTALHGQIRSVGVNYNQVVKQLHTTFGVDRGMNMLYKLEQETIELSQLAQKVLAVCDEFRAKIG